MLVSYKWLKELVDIDAHHKSWLENVNYGMRSKVWNHRLLVSKIVVGEVLSCKLPETHLHVRQVNVGEEKPVRSFVVPQMCVLVSSAR